VILYRFGRQPLECVVNPSAYLFDDHLELITVEGNLQLLPLEEIKAVCFVSEAGTADLFTHRNRFERRPKLPGLWTRFVFRDGDTLDGVLSLNLIDWPAGGYLFTPPHSGSSRQKVFVPRSALSGTELQGVVGKSGTTRSQGKRSGRGPEQLNMFEP
jgi:hypothetical protein